MTNVDQISTEPTIQDLVHLLLVSSIFHSKEQTKLYILRQNRTQTSAECVLVGVLCHTPGTSGKKKQKTNPKSG